MSFDDNIQTVLEAYHQRMNMEDTLMEEIGLPEMIKRRDEFLLAVGQETAQFLYSLVKSSQAKTILEIGTSYGYSTLWLAAAAKENHAKVISLELDPKKAAYAKSQIEKAGLGDFVDFRVGDALDQIQQATESFDFVLLDIWKSLYVPCFDLFYPKLAQGAFVVADNILHPPGYQQEMEKYRAAIATSESFDSILLPIGSGLEVSYLRAS